MAETGNSNKKIMWMIIIGIFAFAFAWNLLFGFDFEDKASVKSYMEGTWVVHEREGSLWNHARLDIDGDNYRFRFKTTNREKFNDWNGLAAVEGKFEILDIKTYTNAASEYRPIIFHGSSPESGIASTKIFFDKSSGLYWGTWGKMKED